MFNLFYDDITKYIDENKELLSESLIDNDLIVNDSNLIDEAQNYINDAFTELQNALKEYDYKSDYDKILCVACLGLWYGRRTGQKHFKSLFDAVSGLFEDQNYIYFTSKKNTMTLKAVHRDGTNIFKFYKIKSGKKYAINLNDILGCI